MPLFQQVAKEHAKKLGQLIEDGGVRKIKKLYNEAQDELERKLARAVGKGSSPITIHQHRTLLAQAKQGQMQIAQKLGRTQAASLAQTQQGSLTSLVSSVRKMEKVGDVQAGVMRVEEAARFRGIVDARKTSLIRQSQTSMAKYGSGVVQRIESDLGLALLTGDTGYEAVERVRSVADMEFWRAERIVRTEQSWAANAVQRDGIEEMASEIEDMYMRWTELVDDGSLRPLDGRVGPDSVAMHGQVARPGDVFEMPASAVSVTVPGPHGRPLRVSDDMIGETWSHPPNRPNDRAVLMAWRPSWGVPGWRCVGGSKVPVKASRQRVP